MATTKISDVDNPARQPFQAAVRFTIDAGQAAGSARVAQVPAKKRLVIEYVWCLMLMPFNNVPGPFSIATILGAPPPLSHRLFFSQQPDGHQGLSQMVRFYADPKTSVELQAIRNGETTLAVTVDAAISGYLVDII